MSANVIALSQLKPGDVLLCYGEGKVAGKIAQRTNSNYTHAAICYSSTEAVESGIAGVAKVPAADIVARHVHVAVFRSPVAWSLNRVKAMNRFLDEIVASKRKYNLKGILDFVARKEHHDLTLCDQLDAYFAGELLPESYNKEKYFCSELVVDCFAASGFMDDSAAIAYKSNTISPGDLGRDPTFGTFVGYLKPESEWNIPEDDEFFHYTRFGEVFGDDTDSPSRS